MSIPDRFLRIAKHKLGELKDWFDQIDEEREARADQEVERKRSRDEARQELDDSASVYVPPSGGTAPEQRPAIPIQPPPMRAPEEIARGSRPDYSGTGRASYSASTPPTARPSTSTQPGPPDPLEFHYRLLGLESGADFASVEMAYNRLAARCEPARFPAGSQDERTARDLRQRLDSSFKILRDTLDTTVRRFDLLEFDTPPLATSPGVTVQKVDEQAGK